MELAKVRIVSPNSFIDNVKKPATSTRGGAEEDITNVNFDDPKFYKHFDDLSHENYSYIEKVLLNLALCHTIIIERKNG